MYTCVYLIFNFSILLNRIDGVVVRVLAFSTPDHGFDPQSDQTKDYKIGNSCFSTKYATLRRKRKSLLVRKQNSVSEWGHICLPANYCFSELAL